MRKSVFIDVREKEIAVYVFDLKGGRYELQESKKYPLGESGLFSFDDLTGDFGSAYLSLPVSHLNFRVVDLPFSDKERIREILPFELDGMILGGTSRVVFDDIVVGSSDGKYQVLAVYTEKTLIQEMLAKLQSYNIDPVCITSLELRKILKDFSLDRLLSPDITDDRDRTDLAAEEMQNPSINLRRDEFSYTRDSEKTKKSLRISGVLLFLITLVLMADLLSRIISTRNEITFFKDDMRRTYAGIFPEEKNVVNELHQFKAHLKELKNKEDLFLGVDPLNLLLRISQIEKQDVVFNEIVLNKRNLTLKGEALSLSTIQDLQGRLGQVFDEVSIADSRASVGGKMLFTITAKEKI
jgi:type II secretory pathway component PulL